MAYLRKQPNVVVAYLFGSLARGRTHPLSDVDIALLLDPIPDPVERVEEQLRLMGDLEEYADREVQVVLLSDAPPLLAHEVVENGRLLYERSGAERIDFEVRTRKIYFDFKPWLDFHTAMLFKDIKEVGLSGRGRRHSRSLEAARRVRERLEGRSAGEP